MGWKEQESSRILKTCDRRQWINLEISRRCHGTFYTVHYNDLALQLLLKIEQWHFVSYSDWLRTSRPREFLNIPETKPSINGGRDMRPVISFIHQFYPVTSVCCI